MSFYLVRAEGSCVRNNVELTEVCRHVNGISCADHFHGGHLKRIIRAFFLGSACVVVLASALVHPNGPVKSTGSAKPLLVGAGVDTDVLRVLERSCQNCHSGKTEWPWYSYVAPVSWLIESDVARARHHMNLSRWDEYTLQQRQDILARLAAAVRSRQMPPARYTLVHPDTKLSSMERDQIYQWARTERRRLTSVKPASVAVGFLQPR